MADSKEQNAKLQILLELIPKTERKAFQPLLEDLFSLTNNIANKSQAEFDKNLGEIQKKFKSLVRSLNVFADSEKIEGPFGKDFLNSIKNAGNAKEIARALAEQFKLVGVELGKLKTNKGVEGINAFGFAIKNAKEDVKELIKEVRVAQKELAKVKPANTPATKSPSESRKEATQKKQEVFDKEVLENAQGQAEKLAALVVNTIEQLQRDGSAAAKEAGEQISEALLSPLLERLRPQELEKALAAFLKQSNLSKKQVKVLKEDSDAGRLKSLQSLAEAVLDRTSLQDKASVRTLLDVIKALELQIVPRKQLLETAKKQAAEEVKISNLQEGSVAKLKAQAKASGVSLGSTAGIKQEIEKTKLKLEVEVDEKSKAELIKDLEILEGLLKESTIEAEVVTKETRKRVEEEFKAARIQEGSLAKVRAQRKELQGKFDLAPTPESREKLKKELDTLDARIKEIKEEGKDLEIEVELIVPEGSIDDVKDRIKKAQLKLNAEVDPKAKADLEKQIAELQKNLRFLTIESEKMTKEAKKQVDEELRLSKLRLGSIAKLKEDIKQIQGKINLEPDPKARKALREELKFFREELKAIENESVEVPIVPSLPEGSIAELKDRIKKTIAKIELEVDPSAKLKLEKQLGQLQSILAKLTVESKETTKEVQKQAQEELRIAKLREGSIAKLEASIKQLRLKIKLEPDPNSRKEFEKELKVLKGQLKDLTVNIPEGSIAALKEQIKGKKIELELAVDEGERQKVQATLDELETKLKSLTTTSEELAQETVKATREEEKRLNEAKKALPILQTRLTKLKEENLVLRSIFENLTRASSISPDIINPATKAKLEEVNKLLFKNEEEIDKIQQNIETIGDDVVNATEDFEGLNAEIIGAVGSTEDFSSAIKSSIKEAERLLKTTSDPAVKTATEARLAALKKIETSLGSQATLNKKIAETEKQLADAVKRRGEAVVGSADFNKAQKQVLELTENLKNLKKGLLVTTSAFADFAQGVRVILGERIAGLLGQTQARLEVILGKSITQAELSLANIRKVAGALAAVVGGGLVVFAGKKLKELSQELKQVVLDATDYSKGFEKVAAVSGLTGDKIAGLLIGFKAIGGSLNDVQDVLGQIAQKLREAQGNSIASRTALSVFSIDASKGLGDLNQALDKLTEGFNALPQGITRIAALGQAAGEEGGRQLSVILPRLEKLNQLASETGLILTEDVRKALKATSEAQLDLNARIEGFKILLGTEAAPILNEFNEVLAEVIKNLVQMVKEFKASGEIEGFVNGFKLFANVAATVTGLIGRFTASVVTLTGGIAEGIAEVGGFTDEIFALDKGLVSADKSLRKVGLTARQLSKEFNFDIGEQVAKARTELETLPPVMKKVDLAFEQAQATLRNFPTVADQIAARVTLRLGAIAAGAAALEQSIRDKRSKGEINDAKLAAEEAENTKNKIERELKAEQDYLEGVLALQNDYKRDIDGTNNQIVETKKIIAQKEIRIEELKVQAQAKLEAERNSKIFVLTRDRLEEIKKLEDELEKRRARIPKPGLEIRKLSPEEEDFAASTKRLTALLAKLKQEVEEIKSGITQTAIVPIEQFTEEVKELQREQEKLNNLESKIPALFAQQQREAGDKILGIKTEVFNKENELREASRKLQEAQLALQVSQAKEAAEKELLVFDEVINKTNEQVLRLFGNITDGSGVAAKEIRKALDTFTKDFDVSKIQEDIDSLFTSLAGGGGKGLARNKDGVFVFPDFKPHVEKAKVSLVDFNKFLAGLREKRILEEIKFNEKEIELQKNNLDEVRKLKLKGLQLENQLQDARFQKEQLALESFRNKEQQKLEILKKANIQREIFDDARVKSEERALALQVEKLRTSGAGELELLQKLKAGYFTLLEIQLTTNKAKLIELQLANSEVKTVERRVTEVRDGKLVDTGKTINEQVRVQKEKTKEIADLELVIQGLELKRADILDVISEKITKEQFLARQNFNIQSATEEVLNNQNKALEKQNDLLEEGGQKAKKRKPAFQVVPTSDTGPDRDIHPERETNPDAPNIASVLGDSFVGPSVELKFDTPENVANGRKFVQDLFHDATAIENFFGAQGAEFAKTIRETADKISSAITKAENEAARIAADEAYALQLEKAKEFQEGLAGLVDNFANQREAIEENHETAVQDIISSRFDLIADVNTKRLDIETKANTALDDLNKELIRKDNERREKDNEERLEQEFQLQKELSAIRLDARDKDLSEEEDFINEKSELLELIKEQEKLAAEGQPEPDRKKAQEELTKLKDQLAKLEQAETRRKEREAAKRAKIAEAEAEAEEIAKTDPDRARKVLDARKKAIDAEFDLEEKFQEDIEVLRKRGDQEAINALTKINAERKRIIEQRTKDELAQIDREIALKKQAREKELQEEREQAQARRDEIEQQRQQELSDLDNFFNEKFADLQDQLQKEKAAYQEQIRDIKNEVIEALEEMGINFEDFGGLLDEVFDALDKKGSTIKETIIAISDALKEIFKTGGAPTSTSETQGGSSATTGGGATAGGGSVFGGSGGGATTGGGGSVFGGAGTGGSSGSIGSGGGASTGGQAGGSTAGTSGSSATQTKGDTKADKQSRAKAALIQAFLNGRKSGSAAELNNRLSNAAAKLVDSGDLSSGQRTFLIRRGLQSATEGEFTRSIAAVFEAGKDPAGKLRFSLEQARGRIRYLFGQYKRKLIPIEGVYAGIQELESTNSIDTATGGTLTALINKIKDGELNEGLAQIDTFFKTAKAGPVKEGQQGKDTDFDTGEDKTGSATTDGGGSSIGGGGGSGGGKKGGSKGDLLGSPGTKDGPIVQVETTTKTGKKLGDVKGDKSGTKGPKGDVKPILPPRKTKKGQLQELFFQKLTGKPEQDLPSLLNQFLLLRNPEFAAAYAGFEDEVVQLGDIQAVVVDYIDQLVKLEYIGADKAPALLDYFKLTGKGGGSATGLVDKFSAELKSYIAPDIQINPTLGGGPPPGGAVRKDSASTARASSSSGSGPGPTSSGSLGASSDSGENRVSSTSTISGTGVSPVSAKGIDDSRTSFDTVPATGAGASSTNGSAYSITIPVTIEAKHIYAIDKNSADRFQDDTIKKVQESIKKDFSTYLGARSIKG